MKSFVFPLALLGALLAFSLWNCSAVSRQTERWTAELEEAEAPAAGGDWAAAEQALEAGYADWSRSQVWLHIVAEHDAVDGAEAMYRRAQAFARTQELSEFLAELADLRNQLRLLAELEKISIKNVL